MQNKNVLTALATEAGDAVARLIRLKEKLDVISQEEAISIPEVQDSVPVQHRVEVVRPAGCKGAVQAQPCRAHILQGNK